MIGKTDPSLLFLAKQSTRGWKDHHCKRLFALGNILPKEEVIKLAIKADSYAQVAKNLGIPEATLYGWLEKVKKTSLQWLREVAGWSE